MDSRWLFSCDNLYKIDHLLRTQIEMIITIAKLVSNLGILKTFVTLNSLKI